MGCWALPPGRIFAFKMLLVRSGIGATAVIIIKPILPYALAFAAGAMIYVVIEELIPESQRESNSDITTTGAMLGFALMMLLDVALD
jgi:ZIP family zinc transporter